MCSSDLELAKVLFDWEISHSTDEVLTMWQQIYSIEGMLDVVQWVRQQQIEACLATNQQTYRTQFMRYTMDYNSHFDHQFYSCELMAAKPNPDYFFEVLLRLDMRPSDVLFIDDSNQNVQAAMDLDIDSIEFRALDYQHPGNQLKQIISAYLARKN